MEEQQYQSLFDYLKRPAGPDLGKAVAEYAKKSKIKSITKEISNPKYTGKVLMYPKAFLDGYFRPDLPF
jgi:ribosomal protein L18